MKCILDPTGKPKRFLWDCPWGQWNGVYQLTGDDLIMAFAEKQKAPAPDAVAPAGNVNYSVLKRIKE